MIGYLERIDAGQEPGTAVGRAVAGFRRRELGDAPTWVAAGDGVELTKEITDHYRLSWLLNLPVREGCVLVGNSYADAAEEWREEGLEVLQVKDDLELGDLTLVQRALVLGVSEEQAVKLSVTLTIAEALTQRCEECGAVIERHQTAGWRFRLHPVRCDECVKARMLAGGNGFDARYVV